VSTLSESQLKVKVLQSNSKIRIIKAKSELRFAFHDRVSDPSMIKTLEDGTKQSDSLERQTEAMKRACTALGAEWREKYHLGRDYKHQHATKGHVREDFKTIQNWVENDEIDAVMYPYSSRLGRYGIESKQHINFLKKHKIRFFTLEQEEDLTNREILFKLGIMAEVNELQVVSMQEEAYKAIVKKAIEKGEYNRGKRKFPYSTEKNPDGSCKPDSEQYKLWKKIRADYKRGMNIWELSQKYPTCSSVISSCLFSSTFHTGVREITLKKEDVSIIFNDALHESVNEKIEIPNYYQIIGTEKEHNDLLQIKNNNMTFDRKHLKNKYLLSRIVRCGNCGKWMSGVTHYDKSSGRKHSYYRCLSFQVKKTKKGEKPKLHVGCRMSVPAPLLEEGFLAEFEYICEDTNRLKKAVEGHDKYQDILDGIIDEHNIQKSLNQKIKNTKASIQEAENERTRKEQTAELDKLYYQLTASEERLIKLEEDKKNNAEKEGLNARIIWIENELKKLKGLSGFSFEEKKKLIGMMFPYNIHPKKREYGITVWKTDNCIRFKANGILDNFLIGDILKTKEGYELHGGYAKKVVLNYIENFHFTCEN
jgi:hypothetical protein